MNVHIVRKEEGSALKILHECCEINDEVEVTQKIALLERRCDLLLHIHDFLQRIVREIEYSLKPPVHSSGPPKLKLHFPMARTEVSVRTIMNSRVLEMMDAVEFVEAQLSYDQHEEGQNIDRALNDDSNILHPTTESSGDKPPPTQAVSIDPSPLRYLTDTSDKPHSDITENIADAATTAATFSEIPPAAVQFATPVDDQSAIRSESNTAIQRLEKVQGQLLSQIAHFTSLSVALHREHYKDDIAEPSTLAVALLQRARAAERAYDGVQAMHYTEQAEVVAARALGAGSQLAISIMLEVCYFVFYS